MNEKKIRREIREWKITGAVLLVLAVTAFVAALFFKLYPVSGKPSDYAKLHRVVAGEFLAAVSIGAAILAVGCHTLRRQAEYTLYLKELISGRKDDAESRGGFDKAA